MSYVKEMINNKKIVFKVPEFPHLSETFIVAQIITAIKLGYEVQIITRKLITHNSLFFPVIIEYNLFNNVIIEDYKIPKNKLIRSFKWLLILFKNGYNLKSIIYFHQEFSKFSLSWLYQWYFYFQFNKASIIHVHYGTYSYPYRVIQRSTIFKPKVIVTFHGHDAFFPLYGHIPNNGYYDKLFNSNALITVNTSYLGAKLIELGCLHERLEIIPVGVDTEFFYPSKIQKQTRDHLKLITVGRLDKVKGQIFCIEAVNKLVLKGINVSLTIIGEGIERENLEALIKKYQLESCVFLKGSKSREEIRDEFWEHDIYLLTGQATTSGLKETQGLATLEAQACGLPAVVFDSGGVKYTLKNGISGFVCNAFDIDAVVSSVIKFIENPILLKDMSKQAVKFVNENFSQKIIDQKWEMIYNELSNEL